MPFPNFHACSIEDSENYDTIRTDTKKNNGKTIKLRYGIKNGVSKLQSILYPKNEWTAAQASVHCRGKKGKFEAAKDSKSCPCGHAGEKSQCEYKKRNKRLIEMKSFDFELKSDITENGEFEGFLATNGNVDNLADRFVYGVWKRTLSINKNKRFPLFKLHNPEKQLGSFSAEEMEEGLYIKAGLNLDLIEIKSTTFLAVPEAWEQYSHIKNGHLNQLSVGFRPTVNGVKLVQVKNEIVREIHEAELVEGSTTPIPVNQMAQITKFKSELINISREDVIGYLLQNRDDYSLWEKVMNIKSYDPEFVFPGGPVDAISRGENNSICDFFFEKIIENYNR